MRKVGGIRTIEIRRNESSGRKERDHGKTTWKNRAANKLHQASNRAICPKACPELNGSTSMNNLTLFSNVGLNRNHRPESGSRKSSK